MLFGFAGGKESDQPFMPKKTKKNRSKQMVKGITLSPKNEATVAPELADVLFDLSLKLEESTQLPVDVQHVLAAIVMASQTGELTEETDISHRDEALLKTIEKYVRVVFANFDGKVGQDD